MVIFPGSPTLERATYSCPWAKTDESRPDRKLAATDLDGNGLVVGVSVHDDAGDTDDVPNVAAREDLGLDDGAG